MDSLFFLAGVLAIPVIVWWVVRNDRVPPAGPTTGLLAMPFEPTAPAKPDPPPRAAPVAGRWGGTGAARRRR